MCSEITKFVCVRVFARVCYFSHFIFDPIKNKVNSKTKTYKVFHKSWYTLFQVNRVEHQKVIQMTPWLVPGGAVWLSVSCSTGTLVHSVDYVVTLTSSLHGFNVRRMSFFQVSGVDHRNINSLVRLCSMPRSSEAGYEWLSIK